MDKYLKRHSDTDSLARQEEATGSTQLEPKKRDWKKVCRKFNGKWELEFAVMEQNQKTVCILCNKTFNDNKVDSIKKHYQQMHSEFDCKFPVGKQVRANEITRLKSKLEGQQSFFKRFLTTSELITLASYKTAWILAQKRKPFSDGELIKEIVLSIMEILLENYEEPLKKDIMQKIENMQLSHQTIARRMQDLMKNINKQLLQHLKSCICFSLALDESCDIRDTAQLIFWIRLVSKDLEIYEEMLTIRGMKVRTRGVDIFEIFKSVAEDFQLDMTKLVSVTTDGAPAMLGQKSGFVGILKQETHVCLVASFHCMIHVENICAQLSGTDILKNVMDLVVKVVNYIRSSATNHRQFLELLKEIEGTEFKDLLFFTNVRWLSRGKVLERFVSLLNPIRNFLQEKEMLINFSEIENKEWQCDLIFLTDITLHINELNLKLQGKGKLICDLAQYIREFVSKLKLFVTQLKDYDFTHFDNMEKYKEDTNFNIQRYVGWLQKLQEKFEERFIDVEKFRPAFQLMQDPFHFDITNSELSKDIANLLSLDRRDFEADMLLLQSQINYSRNDESILMMWTRLLKSNEFVVLNSAIAKLLSMFGTTWVCESTFSAVTFIKSKYRSNISDENLEAELKCAVSVRFTPDFKGIVQEKNCQTSH